MILTLSDDFVIQNQNHTDPVCHSAFARARVLREPSLSLCRADSVVTRGWAAGETHMNTRV